MEVWHIPHCFLQQLRLLRHLQLRMRWGWKIFGSSFADPVIDGHKDGDISDSFWNLVRSDGTAVCGAFAKSKTVYGKRTGKSIQENWLCVDPTGGVSFSGVERTVLRTWNQSDRAGIFRWRTVYV